MSENWYETEKGREIYAPVQHLIESGKLIVEGDKIRCNYRVQHNSPWVVHSIDSSRKCHFFQEMCFQCYGFIHSRCHRCYKVVIRPNTLNQLFELLKIEEEMDEWSKCGVEMRPHVFGRYGGYYYTDSIEEGRAMHKRVRKQVDERLSPKVSVILKRACTEFEQHYGPSDQWEPPSEKQLAFEKRIDEKYITIGHDTPMPEDLQTKAKIGWIEFAYDRGDPTYRTFTGGKKLGLDPVVYHEEEVKCESLLSLPKSESIITAP